MMHPVKRFRPEEAEKLKSNKFRIDLYEGQKYSHSSTLPCILNQQSASEREANSSRTSPADGQSLIDSYISKNNPHDGDDKNSNTNENLFTSEGLQPSYEDLNKIFDNSDDDTVSIQLQISFIHISNNFPVVHRLWYTPHQDPISRMLDA